MSVGLLAIRVELAFGFSTERGRFDIVSRSRRYSEGGERGMATQRRVLRRLVAFATACIVAAVTLLGIPVITGNIPAAVAAPASVYIDAPLQGDDATWASQWTLSGAGALPSSQTGTGWTPRLMTVKQANATVKHSNGTMGCNNAPAWPFCQATRESTRDSSWLTLTTDNTNGGAGGAGTALNSDAFSSDLGVVLEYDQRVYRTNNGNSGGMPATQGGGDGIAVYLVDGNAPNYGNANIDTSPDEAGGYGAGLGYSAVSDTGAGWCDAQQGVAGGYLGVGFDVYGNFQKAEQQQGFGQYHRATRPHSVAVGSPQSFMGVDSQVKSTRIPQSIGLRGSGVRYATAPACDPNSVVGMQQAYGVTINPEINNVGDVTFYSPLWNGGTATDYRFQYLTSDNVWHNWYTAEASTRGGTTAGYMQARVPDSAKPITAFAFQRTSNTAQYREVTNPTGDGIVVGDNDFQALGTKTGGYRWLAGTANLSSYPNPNTATRVAQNDAAIHGAVIDNALQDATQYRRVRLTLTPMADGSREVKVYWSDKLDVSDDQCYAADGTLLTGRTADGTTDTCVSGSPAGTWSYDRSLPLTFTEKLSYDLADNAQQAELPATFRIGFSASNGWAVNYHQIRNLRVTSVIDLAVQKKVQFLAGVGQAPLAAAWADDAAGRAGDPVAYQITAWNNGPSDIDPANPALLTDGLDAVPLQTGASWTATVVGSTSGAVAQVCTDPNYVTMSCPTWGTSVSGTGPITATAPLLWRADALDTPTTGNTAPATGPRVVVTFTGSVQDAAAPGTYPNTADVGANPTAGAQEDDLEFNSDDAEITLIPGWTLEKTADPISGSTVEAGDAIEYTVTAATLSAVPAGSVEGVTITDSLDDVAQYAEFVPGSVHIGGVVPTAPVVVTEPNAGNDYTLTIADLDLPAGTPVLITYQVTAKDPVAANVSFSNYVIGDLPGNPPVQCADAAEADYLVNCSTEHLTPTETLIQVLKVGENEVGAIVPFSGSEWAVYADESGAPDYTDTIVEFGAAPKTTEASTGLFQTMISPGTYWLVETKALEGFNLLPSPVQFTVASDGIVTLADGNSTYLAACPASPTGNICPLIPTTPIDYSGSPTIVVVDIPILDLPATGGTTTPVPYYLGSLVLLLLAAASGFTAVVIRRRTSVA